MSGFDANPYALYDAYGGPAFVAPAHDPGSKKFDATLMVGYAAEPVPGMDHLATVTTAVYGRPMPGVRAEFVVPVHGSAGERSAIGIGDVRVGAAVAIADGDRGALTVTPSCWLPLGSREADFGTGVFGVGGVAAGSVRAGRFEVLGNVGARLGNVVSPHLGAALSADVSPQLRLSAWTVAEGDGVSANVPLLVGGTTRVHLGDNLVVFSAGKGLDANAPSWQVSLAFVPFRAAPLPAPVLDALTAQVHFEPDGDFTNEAKETMFLIARAMTEDPTLTIVVVGHSDPGLPVEASAHRAELVADWLRWNGVSAERLSVLGRGGVDAPVASSDPQNDWVGFARVNHL